jgi:hypothetical protein
MPETRNHSNFRSKKHLDLFSPPSPVATAAAFGSNPPFQEHYRAEGMREEKFQSKERVEGISWSAGGGEEIRSEATAMTAAMRIKTAFPSCWSVQNGLISS